MTFTIIRRALVRGQMETQATEVVADTLRIGRGTSNDLRLDNLAVSLTHAVLEARTGRYVLRDLTGVGATYVNQSPVREASVGPGDSIRIGPYTITLSADTTAGPLLLKVEEDDTRAGDQDQVVLYHQYRLGSGRWTKRRLAVLLTSAILVMVVSAFAMGQHRVFMPGNISLKHAQFADQCANCHTPWKAVWTAVPDKTCQTCHLGPTHFHEHAAQPAPQCASCHLEHQGAGTLTVMRDTQCSQCHGDLNMKDVPQPVFATIHGFSIDHPEFAVSLPQPGKKEPERVRLTEKEKLKDQATLKLNHVVHLNPELQGPDGPEPLQCTSCHRLDEQGAYLKPLSFERDCQRCHQLDFSDKLPGKSVSHRKQPLELHQELREYFSAYYVMLHEQELRTRGVRRLPGQAESKEALFIDDMTREAERYLYSTKSKKCLLCHEVKGPGGAAWDPVKATMQKPFVFPVVQKTAVPERWFPHSRFDHMSHLGLPMVKEKGCVTCHQDAVASTHTTDVLLPKIGSCQTCHFESGGAQADCVSCHVYHDKSAPTLPPFKTHPKPVKQPSDVGVAREDQPS
jgi:pSer/pThr/pTyr-binding forkhead associated (FHA) protein